MVTRAGTVVGAAIAAVVATMCAAQDHVLCGSAKELCQIDGGTYALLLPDPDSRPPVFLYLHGYAGTAKGVTGVKALTGPVLARGYAFLAPEGQVDILHGRNLDWGVQDTFTWERDDQDFVARVIEDATRRFGLDRNRLVIAGYSRGGSMAWDLACAHAELAAGYASYAGGFWEPMVTECSGPVHLFHWHGFADRTVPLEGQNGTWHGQAYEMGDVQAGLRLWRRTMNCEDKATAADTSGAAWTKSWEDCDAGSIRFTLGPGGHKRPRDWANRVLDWFEGLPD